MNNALEWQKVIRQRKNTEKARKRGLTEDERGLQIKKWTTFYRRNLDIYIEDRLQIKLHPFQRVMIYLMGVSQIFFAICSRGLSKTFVVSIFVIAKCLLYPYTEAVITSSTIDQAAKMVKEKIQRELIDKLSPVLKYMQDNGLIKVNVSKDDVNVSFFNGSSIKVLPPLDSSRGERATILIYDECRLLKKSDIDSIFEPMLHPRQAIYLQNENYAQNKELHEEGISIYITSAKFKIEWFWREFKKVVENCYLSKKVSYNFFAGDIFTALKYGLKSEGDWAKIQKTSDELSMRMEYLNEMIGEIENAYFGLELMRRCQKLHTAFRPPTQEEFNEGKNLKNREKKSNETRLLVIDFAFANTVKGGEKNDNTVIHCMSGLYDKGTIIRNLEYIETAGGGESESTIRRIHELRQDYKADYIVLD